MAEGKSGVGHQARRRAVAAVGGLVLLLFLVFGLATALLLHQAREDALARGEQNALAAANTIAAHFQWILEASRQSLQRIDDTLGFRPELLDAGEIQDLDDAIRGLPAGVDARVFDAEGHQRLATGTPGELSIADRPYFMTLRDGVVVVVSRLVVDRVTGEPSFVIAQRLVRGGEFIGVAAIVVPNRLMADFWATLQLGDDSTVSLARDDGWTVARYPSIPDSIDMSGSALFSTYLPRFARGTYASETSPADGVPRLVGYVTIPDSPLVAIASVARESALAPYRERAIAVSLVGLPVALALAGFAVWVTRLLMADERRSAELEDALAQNRLMLREVHHRVKNNLQTVASLVRLRPLPADAKRDLSARIGAMAAVHDQIYKTDRLGDVNLAVYLRDLGNDLRTAYGDRAELVFDLEPAVVDQERAMALGLIVTEVVSNSLRHGFVDPGHSGKIHMRLTSDEADFHLDIRDNGAPFDPDARGEGIGLRLLRSLVVQLGGTHMLDGSSGLSFRLDFPRESPMPASPASGK